jgi:hypothetical protein
VTGEELHLIERYARLNSGRISPVTHVTGLHHPYQVRGLTHAVEHLIEALVGA